MLAEPPQYTEADLETIIVSEEALRNRVDELGSELSAHFNGKDVTVISILSGALVFTADLIRRFSFPTCLDCLRAESYGNSASLQHPPKITNPLKTEIENRHVLVVDDILDSGNTLRSVINYLQEAGPKSITTCVLLDKPSQHPPSLQADFKGFSIPDAFVVGYGLDYAERYRNLNCIGVLKKAFQEAQNHS